MENKKQLPELVIEAGKTESQYWLDLWRYRELLFFLSWRDILVRYKQTAIGVAWSVIRPLLTMAIFSVVFHKLAGLQADAGAPYPIMVFCALLPWQFFANTIAESGNSLIENRNLVSKVYMPRIIIPMSSAVVALTDFIIAFVLLLLACLFYGFVPGWKIVFVPLLLLFTFFAALAPGLILCALNVRYRDFRYVIPFIIQAGLYISPVGFSSSIVPEQWKWLYFLNPVAGIIDCFRWAIIGGETALYLPGVIEAFSIVALMTCFAVFYFRRVEKTLADLI